MQKRNLVYIVVALSSLILLAGFLAGFYVHAVTTAPSTLTISSGIYPGAPSYTVWTESSVFYVKDANGLTVLSSTNSSEALQYPVNLTTAAGGGTVFVKGIGNYANGNVTVKNGVYLILDRGLVSINIYIDSVGACQVENRSDGSISYYSSGNLLSTWNPWTGQQQSSYIIWKNTVTGYYYCKSGTTGALTIWSTNASYVFNYALNAVISTGGEVFAKAADYDLDSPLRIGTVSTSVAIIFKGEGRATQLNFTNGGQGIDYDGASYTPFLHLSISDMYIAFNAQSASDTALDLGYCVANLNNLYINNYNVTHQGQGIAAYPVSNPLGSTWTSIGVQDFDVNYNITQDHVIGNFLFSEDAGPMAASGVSAGIHFYCAGTQVQLNSPHAFESAENWTRAYRFYLNDNKETVLIEPQIEKDANGTVCIEVAHSTGIRQYIYGLTRIGGVTDTLINSGRLPYTTIENSTFWVNAASGSSSCSNGTAFAHGLAGTPTMVALSLHGPTAYNATIVLMAPTVLSLNATHVVIELTAWETVGWTIVPITAAEAQLVYWEVKYWA